MKKLIVFLLITAAFAAGQIVEPSQAAAYRKTFAGGPGTVFNASMRAIVSQKWALKAASGYSANFSTPMMTWPVAAFGRLVVSDDGAGSSVVELLLGPNGKMSSQDRTATHFFDALTAQLALPKSDDDAILAEAIETASRSACVATGAGPYWRRIKCSTSGDETKGGSPRCKTIHTGAFDKEECRGGVSQSPLDTAPAIATVAARPEQAKAWLVERYTKAGFAISGDSQFQITFLHDYDVQPNLVSELLWGNANVRAQRYLVQFTISPQSQGTRVSAIVQQVLQNGYGGTYTSWLTNDVQVKPRLQSFLDAMASELKRGP